MNTFIDFFLFNGATTWTLFGRLAVLVSFSAFGLYILNFIWLLFYDKQKEPSFDIFVYKGFLYSICIIVLLISVEWYFLITENGVQWFKWRRFPISFRNTYLLILPELIVLGGLFLTFVLTANNFRKKIK